MCRGFVAEKLKLRLQPTSCRVDPLGGGPCLPTMHKAHLVLKPKKGLPNFQLQIRVLVLNYLAKQISYPAYHPLKEHPELSAVGQPTAEEWPLRDLEELDIVLGQDYLGQIWKGVPVPTSKYGKRGPSGTPSHFGLIIQGAVPSSSSHNLLACAAVEEGEGSPHGEVDGQQPKAPPLAVPKHRPPAAVKLRDEPPLEKLLREMLDLEYVGITEPKFEKQLSAREEFAVNYLEKNLVYLDSQKRFQVKLPFDPDLPPLEDNFKAALKRLESLKLTLDHSSTKRELYSAAMQKYFDNCHAEKVNSKDEKAAEIFYLPHHGVLKKTAEGKHTKIRIVFDCSAKDRNGNSLNKTMMVGPVPDANLVQILTRFRSNKVAFGADVSECFLTVKVHPDDQNKFRFLWFDDQGRATKYKFTSLIFGSAASPWISSTCLFKLLDKHSGKDKELVEKVKKSIWVDDIVLSEPTVKEARKFIDDLVPIFSEASFKLAKFVASEDAVLDHLDDDQLLFPRGTLEKGSMKVLGVDWDVDKDEIYIGRDFKVAFSKKVDTKQTVARMVGTIYDPLGMLQPWKTGGNLLMKEIWSRHELLAEERGISKTTKSLWKEPLPSDIQSKVDEWKKDFEAAAQIRLPRWISLDAAAESREIYGFADASPFAFGCVVYMRTKFPNGTFQCRFLASRAKVNKVNGYTLPRCELLAAKFLATLVYNLKEYMDLPEDFPCKLFGDSMVALFWIKGDVNSWKTFVHNAVKAIHKFTNPEEWHHVPGLENPADLLTRPHSPTEIAAHPEWLEGPAFAYTDEIPKQPDFYEASEEAVAEFKEKPDPSLLVCAAQVQAFRMPVSAWVEKFSDVRKLLRIIVRFKRAAKAKSLKALLDPKSITSTDLVAAADELMKLVQQRLFADEIKALQRGKPLSSKSKIRDLNPVWEDGLLRARGRVELLPHQCKKGQLGPLFEQNKPEWHRPIIIGNDGQVVPRVIQFIHEDLDHAATDTIHALMRRRWWLVRSRRVISDVKKACIACRRVSAPAPRQIDPPLPRQRLDYLSPPFTNIAIDGLGPLHVRHDEKKKGLKKVWILVISCMTTRGVNLELLEDNAAESFVEALRRHFADFGKARSVRLDNFPSHKRMAELFDSLNSGNTVGLSYRSAQKTAGISWSWSAVYQPSTNGVIERAVKSVKEILLKVVGRGQLDRPQLATLLKEVKQVINSRPLIQLPRGSVDDGEIITPNHLIYGHALVELPLGEKVGGRKPSTGSYWSQKQSCLRQFKEKFKDQYLDSLLTLKKNLAPEAEPKVGDFVMMRLPNKKRHEWPLGIIQSVLPGIDGLGRRLRIRVQGGTVERSIYSVVVLRHVDEPDPQVASGERQAPSAAQPLEEVEGEDARDPLEEQLVGPAQLEEVEDVI